MLSKKLNILVAYPYLSKAITNFINNHKEDIRFVLDSGAFTAWKSGKPIELDDYCRFIENLPFKPWRYFMLDAIGDPHQTMKNYQTMLRRGFDPIPVFTRGEDASVLEEFYKTSEVVGLGGLVGTKGNKGFVKEIMQIVGKRKVHWLGFTNKDFVAYFKPYMCDSSSWESAARFGSFCLYEGRGKYVSMKKSDFAKRPNRRVLKLIESYGYNPLDFSREENWRGTRSLNRAINGHSGVRASLDIEDKLGVKKFLACTTSQAVECCYEGFVYEMNRR